MRYRFSSLTSQNTFAYQIKSKIKALFEEGDTKKYEILINLWPSCLQRCYARTILKASLELLIFCFSSYLILNSIKKIKLLKAIFIIEQQMLPVSIYQRRLLLYMSKLEKGFG
jgi:hypothetical protein